MLSVPLIISVYDVSMGLLVLHLCTWQELNNDGPKCSVIHSTILFLSKKKGELESN